RFAGEVFGAAEAGELETVERRAAAFGALRVVGGVAAENGLGKALLAQLTDERGGFGAEAGVVDEVGVEGAQVVDLGREVDRVGGEVDYRGFPAVPFEGVLEEAGEAHAVVVVLLPEDRRPGGALLVERVLRGHRALEL